MTATDIRGGFCAIEAGLGAAAYRVATFLVQGVRVGAPNTPTVTHWALFPNKGTEAAVGVLMGAADAATARLGGMVLSSGTSSMLFATSTGVKPLWGAG